MPVKMMLPKKRKTIKRTFLCFTAARLRDNNNICVPNVFSLQQRLQSITSIVR